jgi:8-oxo-dGTP pyrophosphatase MutT (NUDIX family)
MSSELLSTPGVVRHATTHQSTAYIEFELTVCGRRLDFGQCLFGAMISHQLVDIAVAYSADHRGIQINVCLPPDPSADGRCCECHHSYSEARGWIWYRQVPLGHRKRCPLHLGTVGAGQRGQVRVGVTAVIEDPRTHRILLTRRSKRMRSFPGAWVFPGGHVDVGEHIPQAVIREVREETGLVVEPASLSLMGVWESSFPYDIALGPVTHHHLVLIFRCQLHTASVLHEGAALSQPTMTAGYPLHTLRPEYQIDPQEVECLTWLAPSEYAGDAQALIEQLSVDESDQGALRATHETLAAILQATTRSVRFIFELLTDVPGSPRLSASEAAAGSATRSDAAR